MTNRIWGPLLLSALLGAAWGCDNQVAYSSNQVVEPEPAACQIGDEIPCDCEGIDVEGVRTCLDGDVFGPCACPDPPGRPALVARPSRVEVGALEVGQQVEVEVSIVNVGDAGSSFSMRVEGGRAFGLASSAQGALAPGESMQVVVLFSPLEPIGYESTLVVEDVSGRSGVSVPLSGRGVSLEACAFIEPGSVDFGRVEIGQRASTMISIFNCGQRPLEVEMALPAPAFPFQVSSAERFEVGAGEVALLEVSFAPVEDGRFAALLVLRTSDPAQPVVQIPIVGQAFTLGRCPVAVAGARVQGQGGPFEPSVEIQGTGTIELDGSASFDPNSMRMGVAAYEWAILERPLSSSARLSPSSSAVAPSLFVDVPGRYTIELQVIDEEGRPSCEGALVEVFARPDGGLSVELTWVTPEDPIQDDDRSGDLDLHLLYPDGRWGTRPGDCFWRNASPDWGQRGETSDDPRLEEDALARGPERISIEAPEPVLYRVGVHYGRDNGFGPSIAAVRIFMGEVLVYEALDKVLTDPMFWEVAVVDWGRVRIEPVDEVFPDLP